MFKGFPKTTILAVFLFSVLAQTGCTTYGVAAYDYRLCEDKVCTEVTIRNTKNIGKLVATIETPSGIKVTLEEQGVDASSPLKESSAANLEALSVIRSLIPASK